MNSCEMQYKTHIVLEEVRAGSSFKRCAVVDIVPTGSYQATLKQIGLDGVGFEGFPSGTPEDAPYTAGCRRGNKVSMQVAYGGTPTPKGYLPRKSNQFKLTVIQSGL